MTDPNHIDPVVRRNIAYYDQIAAHYNAIMKAESSNAMVRQAVMEKFCHLVKDAAVLDFGGGTGLDMEWMTRQNKCVFFCEPSFAMRSKAIAYNNGELHRDNIIFLRDDQCDFSIWEQHPPFDRELDGLLANFAVLNCIPGIDELFRNLAGVLRPGGHFLALLLNNHTREIWATRKTAAIKALFFGTTPTFSIYYKGHRQTVYLHTKKKIRKACAPWFNFQNEETIPGSGFVMLYLTRK